MVDFTTFLVAVLCFVDDWLKGKRLRERGPQPLLSDSEVLTIKIIGEFPGLDTDKAIFETSICSVFLASPLFARQ